MIKEKSKRTDQEIFWEKQYAEEYIRKNSQFNNELAIDAWSKMLISTSGVSSILECGCNIGRNLHSLSRVLPNATQSIVEISKPAFEFVSHRYNLEQKFNGSILDSNLKGSFNLVFTMGVLIHINPDQLIENLSKIHNYSNKYILIGEYFNRTPTMVDYQGEKDRLFKRDFGRFFLDNFSVEVLDYGFLWGHVYDSAGFDDITWWLFQKK